ncbi:hypothetical protein [Endozoicomonas numazuensis]|uniref:hypothetical protein n=1 Tax=Endozoicomonas numazuensis TaxID=1137799 RepID=UPI000AFEFC2C|nr:hypothetical protein [Endozoicomonas numazuensis]
MIELEEKVFSYIAQAGPAELTLNILTMLLGYTAGKLLVKSELQARTICLEAGLQYGTLSLLVTTTILSTPSFTHNHDSLQLFKESQTPDCLK